MCREVECLSRRFPNRKSSDAGSAAVQRTCICSAAAPGGAPGDALSCWWRHTLPFVSVTPQLVRAVTQWTHATQLSNFDNALLCSAFKFYYTIARLSGAFLHFSLFLITTEKCSKLGARAQCRDALSLLRSASSL